MNGRETQRLIQVMEAQVYDRRYRDRLTLNDIIQIAMPDTPEVRFACEQAANLVSFQGVRFDFYPVDLDCED